MDKTKTSNFLPSIFIILLFQLWNKLVGGIKNHLHWTHFFFWFVFKRKPCMLDPLHIDQHPRNDFVKLIFKYDILLILVDLCVNFLRIFCLPLHVHTGSRARNETYPQHCMPCIFNSLFKNVISDLPQPVLGAGPDPLQPHPLPSHEPGGGGQSPQARLWEGKPRRSTADLQLLSLWASRQWLDLQLLVQEPPIFGGSGSCFFGSSVGSWFLSPASRTKNMRLRLPSPALKPIICDIFSIYMYLNFKVLVGTKKHNLGFKFEHFCSIILASQSLKCRFLSASLLSADANKMANVCTPIFYYYSIFDKFFYIFRSVDNASFWVHTCKLYWHFPNVLKVLKRLHGTTATRFSDSTPGAGIDRLLKSTKGMLSALQSISISTLFAIIGPQKYGSGHFDLF